MAASERGGRLRIGPRARLGSAVSAAGADASHVGLDDVKHFGAHGADIVRALATASPRPLTDYRDLLDFGVGVGRVARVFKGFEGAYAGVDVDADNIAWVAERLPWVEAAKTEPGAALPFSDARFDAVISVSVFTHMNEQNQLFYLDELRRVTQPERSCS